MRSKLHLWILAAIAALVMILLLSLPAEFYISLRAAILSNPAVAAVAARLFSLPSAVKLLLFLILVIVILSAIAFLVWLGLRSVRAFLSIFGKDHITNYRRFDSRCRKALTANGMESNQLRFCRLRTFGDKVKKYLCIAILTLCALAAGYLTLDGANGVFVVRALLALLAMGGVPLFYGLIRLLMTLLIVPKTRMRRYR